VLNGDEEAAHVEQETHVEHEAPEEDDGEEDEGEDEEGEEDEGAGQGEANSRSITC
jgi:hypothetical protein